MNTFHVLVIGGGYAGCMAANRLRAHPGMRVTLVTPHTHFVERIRLHQLAAGTHNAVVNYADLLHADITRVTAGVDIIDPQARTVLTTTGHTIAYDLAIYATGSGGHHRRPEHTYGIGSYDDAQALANALTLEAQHVVVVGGGLTGIEMAAELAHTHQGHTVTLISSTAIASTAGRVAQQSIDRRLTTLGVTVMPHTTVADVTDTQVILHDERAIRSDVTIWATGFSAETLAAHSGLAVDDNGRLLVDTTLTSISDPHIVGAGDGAVIDGYPLRMSCQSAMPLGAQAAATAHAIASEKPAPAVNQGFAAQCIGLGPHHGAVTLTRRDDTPHRIVIGGRLGGLVKEQVCHATVRWIGREAQRPGSYRWRNGQPTT